MGKLHKIKRLIARDPQRWKGCGAWRFGKTWIPGYTDSYRAFVRHVHRILDDPIAAMGRLDIPGRQADVGQGGNGV